MLLAVGMLGAFIHSQKTGEGQVVDAAMIDGSSLLMSMFYSFKEMGFWTENKESNLLDGAAHFYDTYECSDKKHIAIGAIEPQFYKELLEKLEINDDDFLEIDSHSGEDEVADDFWFINDCFADVDNSSRKPSNKH